MLNKLYFDKWDYAYMDCAKRFAELSSAKRLKVGAIVVKDNRIISIGYNGMPANWNNVCEDEFGKTKPEVLHAEENALCKLAGSYESAKGATLYITHSPCGECSKQIFASGIVRVVYQDHYFSNSHGDGIEFLKSCSVRVEQL